MKLIFVLFALLILTSGCSSNPRSLADVSPTFSPSQVIYGIYPSAFAKGQKIKPFEAIRRRIPELKSLGADILWILPVFKPATVGMGYDISDYYAIDPALGTVADLKNLVLDAHSAGLKVILDIALNHTSIEHPFAQDVITHGNGSSHYSFYQHEMPPGPYFQFYNSLRKGNGDFVYYFWEDLVNLNYANVEVQNYAVELLEYWVKKLDIDGYRLDAAWGPASRWPDFFKAVNTRLSKLKPGIFLLAEDKAGYPENYEGSDYPHLRDGGISAAYDWNNMDAQWVSKWSFQNGSSMSETVFDMGSDPQSAANLFSQGLGYTQNAEAQPLRYLENNDTPSFVSTRTLNQTRFAAEAVLLLPGDPLIFHGQETANAHGQWDFPSYDPEKTMRSYNPEAWDFYKNLIHLRKTRASLREGTLKTNVSNAPGEVSFSRAKGENADVITVQFERLQVLLNGSPIENFFTP